MLSQHSDARRIFLEQNGLEDKNIDDEQPTCYTELVPTNVSPSAVITENRDGKSFGCYETDPLW